MLIGAFKIYQYKNQTSQAVPKLTPSSFDISRLQCSCYLSVVNEGGHVLIYQNVKKKKTHNKIRLFLDFMR